MNYFGFQGRFSQPLRAPAVPSPSSPASPGSRCRPPRECCLRIAQRISDTFLKCKTFRLRVRQGVWGKGPGVRWRGWARCLGSLLQERGLVYETIRRALRFDVPQPLSVHPPRHPFFLRCLSHTIPEDKKRLQAQHAAGVTLLDQKASLAFRRASVDEAWFLQSPFSPLSCFLFLLLRGLRDRA